MASMISHKRKWLFVHPPRTGGTSVSFALKGLFEQKVTGKHLRLWEYDIDPKKYFKFMTVRNPWERVASHIGKFAVDGQRLSMKRAIFAALPLCEYGLTEMDFMLRCEHLEEDFAALCMKLCLTPQDRLVLQDLRQLNQSNHLPYRDYFPGDSRYLVAERFGYEIKQFGYKF